MYLSLWGNGLGIEQALFYYTTYIYTNQSLMPQYPAVGSFRPRVSDVNKRTLPRRFKQMTTKKVA